MSNQERLSLGQIISERRKLFIAVLLAFMAVVFIASLQMTPVYEAKTVVLVEKKGPEQKISFGTAQNPFLSKANVNSEYQVLRSRNFAQEVASRLMDQEGFASAAHQLGVDDDTAADWLLNHTKVRPLKGSDVVEIRARASDPGAVSQVANTYAEVYVELARDRAKSEIRQVREFLADQVNIVRERLESSEINLRDFQQQTGVASLGDETRALVEQLATFESSYNHAKADLLSHQKRLKLLRSQLAKAEENLSSQVPMVTGSVINQLRVELADRMAYREKFLAQGYDVEHAKIQELERQVAEIQERLATAIDEITGTEDIPSDPLSQMQNLVDQILAEEVTYYALEARVASLRAAVKEYDARLATLPQKSFEMNQLAHDASVDEEILAMLLQRYEEARIEEAGLMGTAQIIDHAVVPTLPVRPDFRLNMVLALVIGSLFASFSCLLAHRLHRKVRSAREASQLSGHPVLVRVPELSVRDLKEGSVHLKAGPFRRLRLRQRCRRAVASGSLLLSMTPWAPVVEAIRALRVFLVQGNEPTPKVVLVTSPGQGDGKTATACNLALVLASGGSRVLLIDADMRHPSVRNRFKVKANGGLPDLLSGEKDIEGTILKSPHPDLDLLLTRKGVDNPHDLLTNPRLPEAIEKLRHRYDHVVIDSPPIVPVIDTAILSQVADTTLLVVRIGHTECEAIPHASQVLRSIGADVGGIVLNADTRPPGGKRYYYYYHSRHSSRIDSPRRPRALPSGDDSMMGEEIAA